jgi:hypothetical protein
MICLVEIGQIEALWACVNILESKKPPQGRLLGGDMTYEDWLWIKFGGLVFLAAVYGFWRGINGLPLEREQNDIEAAPRRD